LTPAGLRAIKNANTEEFLEGEDPQKPMTEKAGGNS
jgi:hypothetical protein